MLFFGCEIEDSFAVCWSWVVQGFVHWSLVVVGAIEDPETTRAVTSVRQGQSLSSNHPSSVKIFHFDVKKVKVDLSDMGLVEFSNMCTFWKERSATIFIVKTSGPHSM